MTGGTPPELRTDRLLLRRWRESDREPFAVLNADPQVMEHFRRAYSRPESDALFESIEQGFIEHGFGLWAVEVVGMAGFIGFVGLGVPRFESSFTPCVEAGWRIGADHWGRGYATEGARAAVRFGFEQIGLPEIVSFTTTANARSRRVMEKLGMRRDPTEDFDHPYTPGWHGQRHVLYRLSSASYPKYGSPP